MKKVPALVTMLVVVFLVAAAASVISLSLCAHRKESGQKDAHAWIQSRLGMTEEQGKSLEPIEANYRAERLRLENEMHSENVELARVILQDRKDSERIRACIEKIHGSMGELQNITIGHVFAMRTVLTPAQYDRLLNLTADALSRPDNLAAEHAGK